MLPKVSLSPKHKYTQDNAFQTSFMGRLTDEAIHRYCLQGRYGSVRQKEAEEQETLTKARKNVKSIAVKILANKYVTL